MRKGDINNDGLVNDIDVWLLYQAVADKFKLSQDELEAAGVKNGKKPTMQNVVDLQRMIGGFLPGDVNGDGVFDEQDAQTLKKEILKILRLDKYVQDDNAQLCVKDALLLQKLIEGIIAGHMAKQPKKNKITIPLAEFEKGEYLSWFVTTQASYKVKVTLRDDKKEYFSSEKQSMSIEPPLAVGSGEYIGQNLVLEVSIPQSEEIRVLPSMTAMITDTGKVLGHALTCCGEDWTDNDYNDFYINLVGWKSKR